VGFDFDAAGFAGLPVEEATPGPVFGFIDEAAFDWVAVDVLELLDEFGMGEDVEVVIAGLPELRADAFEEFGGLSLEGSQSIAKPMEFWFAEEHVDVLGHEDIAVEKELVASAEGFEGVEEGDAGVIVIQVGEAVVTTEGEEVEMAFGLVSLETTGHGTSLWPRVGKEM
jgi:hypothetical protein